MSDANLPLTPTGHYLLLEERQAIKKTAGGIILAPETQDAIQYLCQIGKIVAMGEQCYAHAVFDGKPWARLGDNILFYKNAGIRIDLKADNADTSPVRYRLLKDNDVLAQVHDSDRIKGAVV
jgi:co-chaperonin GroES (HSP10)